MIGGAGSLPSKMARTKSRPVIDAITCVGVTPYSTSGVAGLSDMAQVPFVMMVIIQRSCVACNCLSRTGCSVQRCSAEPGRNFIGVVHGPRLEQRIVSRMRRIRGKRAAYARLFARIRSANRLNR